MKALFKISAAALLLLSMACPVVLADNKDAAIKEVPAVEPTNFVEFVEDNPISKLRTATVTYGDGKGLKVDLIGAIHIADESYYNTLNESFENYDALLYEMVGSEREGPLKPGDLDTGDKGGSPIRKLQVMMQKTLELDYQLSGIDYTAKNFVHADMDAETFSRMQKERKEGLLAMVLQSYKAQFKMMAEGKAPATMGIGDMIKILLSGDSANGLKLVLARQFDEIEYLITAMEPEGGSVILTERNKVALKILDKQIKKGSKNIGIFYGAAHLVDMEERLINEFGLKKTKTVWNDAWSMKTEAKPPETPEADATSPAEGEAE
ncbi:MAG: hypothetical protein ACI8XO_001412 [Verrucomicrobiales bacterium]|jgi:hypothetical protein